MTNNISCSCCKCYKAIDLIKKTHEEKHVPKYQIACNECGAGKPLYYELINGDLTYFEPYTLIETRLTTSEKKCPKCDSENVEVIN